MLTHKLLCAEFVMTVYDKSSVVQDKSIKRQFLFLFCVYFLIFSSVSANNLEAESLNAFAS